MKQYLFFIFILSTIVLNGQERPIFLENPSFETNALMSIDGWGNCTMNKLPLEYNLPLILPDGSGAFMDPIDGNTYLALQIRDNSTWSIIQQKLESPMDTSWCYLFQLALAKSDYLVDYSFFTKRNELYTNPAILRIWGGSAACKKEELLATTVLVDHVDWDSYSFYLCPTQNHNYLFIEAYYENDESMVIPNGHILIDDASPLYPLPYAEGEIMWEQLPKSGYFAVDDTDQLAILIEEYGKQIKFEQQFLPSFIYLDAQSGLRYGNLYFDMILSSIANFDDKTIYLGVKGNSKNEKDARIKELKAVVREHFLSNEYIKIKRIEKFDSETDWLIDTEYLKMKIVDD